MTADGDIEGGAIMRLYYVRHGDPIYNPDSLTPLGHRQAEAMAHRMSLRGLDRIYSSTSIRAQQTAQPTAEVLKKEVTLLDWAHENHAWAELSYEFEPGKRTWVWGQGKFRLAMQAPEVRALGRRWYEHPMFKEYPSFGEGIQRIQREADAFLASHGYVHDLEKNIYISEGGNHENIGFFAHEGFGLAFLSCILDIPYPMFSTHFALHHTRMNVIEFPVAAGPVVPNMLQFGGDAHLFADRLPCIY